jgi:SAM-dependent methyltransferase
MQKDTILGRILAVHERSKMFDVLTENPMEIINKNTEDENSQADKKYESGTSFSIQEVDINYLLFFNEIHKDFLRSSLKKILKKALWPILKRQVFFNVQVRNFLRHSLRQNYALVTRISVLEQKLEQKTGGLLDLAQKIEMFFSEVDRKVKDIDRSEQSLLETIAKIDSNLKLKIDELDCKLTNVVHKVGSEINAIQSLTSKAISVQNSKIASSLWFNDAINISYDDDKACWAGTNERIVEKNFVLQSLARSYNSAQIQILDIGSAESSLAYELASLNYAVTAIDIRVMSLSHPNLKFIKSDICQPDLDKSSFDCVIALSTIEHIGLGWYGDEVGEGLDRQAVNQIHALLKPKGIMILTVPYGNASLTPVHRIYDRKSLQNLIEGFNVVSSAYGIRIDNFTYTVTDNEAEASEKEHDPENYLPGAVAMFVCRKE